MCFSWSLYHLALFWLCFVQQPADGKNEIRVAQPCWSVECLPVQWTNQNLGLSWRLVLFQRDLSWVEPRSRELQPLSGPWWYVLSVCPLFNLPLSSSADSPTSPGASPRSWRPETPVSAVSDPSPFMTSSNLLSRSRVTSLTDRPRLEPSAPCLHGLLQVCHSL